MKNFVLFATFFLSAISYSCEDPCDSIDPAPAITGFLLLDSVTGKSLIGEDRLYHPDSLLELNLGSPFTIYSSDSIVSFSYRQVSSGKPAFFKLSESDTDTIQAEYVIRPGECFDSSIITSFKYNGVEYDIMGEIEVYK